MLELDELEHDDIEVLGRMPWSSNATFLVEIGPARKRAVYKPGRGERPLRDFPPHVYRRELAAYRLSEELGFGFVPTTIERDGPMGPGSIQEFIDADFEQHYFTLRDDADLVPTFRRLCAFDIVSNNTDRKSGHCLLDANRKVWAIDNGLSFHHQSKLRTVIWDFAGEHLPADVVEPLTAIIDDGVPESVAELLDPIEVDAVAARTRALLVEGRFPHDHTGWGHPWPLV